jgi:streptomycin 6-kinase
MSRTSADLPLYRPTAHPWCMDLPQQLLEKVPRIFGDKGRSWLPTLAGILQRCRHKWRLADGVPAPFMSMNYIEFTTTEAGLPVALKVGVPHDDLFTEMDALRAYDGVGAARFIDADHDLAAILMERARPGTMLWESGDDAEQTQIAGGVLAVLPVEPPAQHAMPHLADQVAGAFAQNRSRFQGLMPEELMRTAEDLLSPLLEAPGGPILLHGDLHHENILHDERRGWLAIDPKGVIGPRPYQAARLLNNRIPETATEDERAGLMMRRLDILSDMLDCAPSTLAAATFVDCILGTSWSFEDEGSLEIEPTIMHARVLQRFI